MESSLFFPFLMYAPSTATLRTPAKRFFFFLSCENVLQIVKYRRTTVTRTLKGNEKQFELGGSSSYLVNVNEIFIKCRGNFFKTMPYASTSAFGSLSIIYKITDIDSLSRGK